MNEYAYETTVYLYDLTALQSWIFAMQYWQASNICSFPPSQISATQIGIINFIGVCLYTIIMVVLWINIMVSFPRYSNDGSLDLYNDWRDGTQMRIYETTVTFWLLLIILSTLISIHAITKIIRTAKVLSLHNTNVSFNIQTMKLHSVLLIS